MNSYTVARFGRLYKKAVTVLTIEPNIGVYREPNGVIRFLERWGYSDMRGRDGRRNFGGIYRVDHWQERTRLVLRVTGYDPAKPDRLDPDEYLSFFPDDDTLAAGWSFRKLLVSWTRKHAHSIYVPAMTTKATNEYYYGPHILVCAGTDLLLMLSGLTNGLLYLAQQSKRKTGNCLRKSCMSATSFVFGSQMWIACTLRQHVSTSTPNDGGLQTLFEVTAPTDLFFWDNI